MNIEGVFLNYYFHCHRQLWLYAKNINMEHCSEDVKMGKIISDNTYQKEKHDLYIEDFINKTGVLDFYDRKKRIIHEVKKSKSMEELHIWQVKFYIYLLKQIGIEGVTGIIDYPKLKKNIKVELSSEDMEKIDNIIKEIDEILKHNFAPKPINKPFCKKCSYYEFCYV